MTERLEEPLTMSTEFPAHQTTNAEPVAREPQQHAGSEPSAAEPASHDIFQDELPAALPGSAIANGNGGEQHWQVEAGRKGRAGFTS